jgi:hypothetical protein
MRVTRNSMRAYYLTSFQSDVCTGTYLPCGPYRIAKVRGDGSAPGGSRTGVLEMTGGIGLASIRCPSGWPTEIAEPFSRPFTCQLSM